MSEITTNGHKSQSNLERLIQAGHFVITGELGPPKGWQREVIERKGELLRGMVDAINLTDNQTAIVRMASIAAGRILVEMDLEPVIQMTCRDRNRLGIQSDLLGAAALGIHNVLCLSGDHQSFGNHPTAKNVHDVDSIQLVQIVAHMRHKALFQCGEEIEGGGPSFLVGAAANPFGDPFEFRPHRLAKKVAAGANFIQTQLIYDIPRFKEYMKRVVEMDLHKKVAILAGVGPLKSSGMAKYMRDRVPGMIVDDYYVDEMVEAIKGIPKEEKGARRDAWRKRGIELCIEQIQQLREIEGVAGVHIMAIEWEAAVRPIVEGAGLLPRPVPPNGRNGI
ncbi:MAG: methylenetetrahydrofolate reductase [Anaerolineae bacterium]|jgi:methylenetetrahydrofolate reductase (NADPH)|nr:methylenetetrahydrofolate reductase [Anaerolineae bacterium]